MKKTTNYIVVVLVIIVLIFLFSRRASMPETTPITAAEATQNVNQGLDEVETGITEVEETEQDIDTSDLEGLEEDLNIDI